MKYRFAGDCHTHSDCSFDGSDPAREMCARAEELGLYVYALTDHCECNKYEEAPGHESGYCKVVRKAWDAMETCREAFPRLRFLRGVELGQPLQDLSAAEDALSGREYDYVIGSVHNVKGERDFYFLGRQGLSAEQWDGLFTRYFREIADMARWGGFDSLAHITYPLRYVSQEGDVPGFEAHREEMDEALTALIRADKALEMNTSRLGKPGPVLPEKEVFTRYRELGGKLVTLGSDAHSVTALAQGIELGIELLRDVGFTEYAVYENRQPVLLPLE